FAAVEIQITSLHTVLSESLRVFHIKKNIAIEIPEHYIPSFKPAKIFVDQVKSSTTVIANNGAE
ncbi:MAG: hypothetical protein AAFV80_09520, partial [Bacteroidota bacterium]